MQIIADGGSCLQKNWPNFKRLTNCQYGFMGLSGHVKYKHVIQATIDHIKWTGCMIYRMGKMKKYSCYGPYDNIILTRCTIYGMGENEGRFTLRVNNTNYSKSYHKPRAFYLK